MNHRRRAYRSCSWPTKDKRTTCNTCISGAYTVGKFNQLGKATWLKIFMNCGSDTIGALGQLLIVNETSAQQLAMLASFVCDVYCPKCIDIKAFLNYDGTCSANLCREQQASTDVGSPQTAHSTCPYPSWRMGTGQYTIAQQELLDPLQNGFCKYANGDLVPHTTDDLPAAKTSIEMVNCHCK